MERLKQQMNFILEIDKSKQINRQTYIADGSRKENDAEHSWHLAIMAFLMAEHANEKVDVARVMEMVLIHDLVEIDAGDTYAYDTKGYETKRAREEECADRVFGLLPEDQKEFIRNLWEEFESGETPEAKFANSLDKIQPVLLNDASNGKSWVEHEVHRPMILKRNEHTAEGSEKMWDYCKQIIDKNIENGKILE